MVTLEWLFQLGDEAATSRHQAQVLLKGMTVNNDRSVDLGGGRGAITVPHVWDLKSGFPASAGGDGAALASERGKGPRRPWECGLP